TNGSGRRLARRWQGEGNALSCLGESPQAFIEQDAYEETKKRECCEGQKGPEDRRQPLQSCPQATGQASDQASDQTVAARSVGRCRRQCDRQSDHPRPAEQAEGSAAARRGTRGGRRHRL